MPAVCQGTQSPTLAGHCALGRPSNVPRSLLRRRAVNTCVAPRAPCAWWGYAWGHSCWAHASSLLYSAAAPGSPCMAGVCPDFHGFLEKGCTCASQGANPPSLFVFDHPFPGALPAIARAVETRSIRLLATVTATLAGDKTACERCSRTSFKRPLHQPHSQPPVPLRSQPHTDLAHIHTDRPPACSLG